MLSRFGVGDPLLGEAGMQLHWNWNDDTRPFASDDHQHPQPARFKLHQVDDDKFELLEPFTFARDDGTLVIPVNHKLLGKTDLASIPSYLGWFARRHGRHTPAALLHDQLVTDTPEQLPAQARMQRTEADLLFREALRASDVALVKGWILWTGVTLATRLRRSGLGATVAMVVWFAAALAGTALLVYGW